MKKKYDALIFRLNEKKWMLLKTNSSFEVVANFTEGFLTLKHCIFEEDNCIKLVHVHSIFVRI